MNGHKRILWAIIFCAVDFLDRPALYTIVYRVKMNASDCVLRSRFAMAYSPCTFRMPAGSVKFICLPHRRRVRDTVTCDGRCNTQSHTCPQPMSHRCANVTNGYSCLGTFHGQLQFTTEPALE